MKKTSWKIYFWFLLIISTPKLAWVGFPRVWEIIDVILSAIAMLGLFAFCWQKKIFTTIFWKIFFFGFIVWSIYLIYFSPQFAQEIMEINTSVLPDHVIIKIALFILIPQFIALYSYAFKDEETKNNEG